MVTASAVIPALSTNPPPPTCALLPVMLEDSTVAGPTASIPPPKPLPKLIVPAARLPETVSSLREIVPPLP